MALFEGYRIVTEADRRAAKAADAASRLDDLDWRASDKSEVAVPKMLAANEILHDAVERFPADPSQWNDTHRGIAEISKGLSDDLEALRGLGRALNADD